MLSKVQVNRCGKYGYIYPESKHFDDYEFLGNEKCLNYKITKIKLLSGKKDSKIIISGIQMWYKSLITGEEKTSGLWKGDEAHEKEDEFVLEDGEYIADYGVSIEKQPDCVGKVTFTTNKGRVFTAGGESGEAKRTEVKNDNLKNFVVFIYGCVRQQLESLGVGYASRAEYDKIMFGGFMELRYALKKKEDYKAKILAKKDSLEESEQILLRAVQLPDASFKNILSYCRS